MAARDKYAQGYRPSQGVLSAQDALSQAQSARPGDYSSRYDAEIQSIYRQLMDRPAFRYDLYADPLYQQYKEQYRLLGSQAMMDTMGQASGLTGGYGSTYSQNAGQQAYNGYLQQLNDRVPQLYGLAYDRYDREGKQLLERYSLAQTGESRDYARWQDGYNRYLAQLQNAQNRYDSAYAQDYNAFRDMLTYWQNQVAQEQAQQNWQAELDYAREQWEYQKGKR